MQVLTTIAAAQNEGRVCAFIDAAHNFDTDLAIGSGIKLEDLLVSQPDNMEQALEIADTLVRTGAIDLIVVDLLGTEEIRLSRLRALLELAKRTTTVLLFVA